jgi:hypothetical protein
MSIERFSTSGGQPSVSDRPAHADPYAQNSKPSSIEASSTSVRIVSASGAIGKFEPTTRGQHVLAGRTKLRDPGS